MHRLSSRTQLLALALVLGAAPAQLRAACVPCDNPVVQWIFDGPTRSPVAPLTCTMPLVVQLTDDNGDGAINCADGPDVVILPRDSNVSGHILALDGATGSTLFEIPSVLPDTIAAADLDADGSIEILARSTPTGNLLAFEHDGTPAWSAPPHHSTPLYSMLAVADLDQDGSPEIFNDRVVRAADGSLAFLGTDGVGASDVLAVSHAADLVPSSPGLELLAGNTAYTATGGIAWIASVRDGLSAIGDVDADGRPDVAVVRWGSVSLLDGETGAIRHTMPFYGRPYQPAMGDIDGDGGDEIVLPKDLELVALDWIGTGLVQRWSLTTQDLSGCSAAVLFDFDADGALDVVYHDELNWYILDGPTGAVISAIPFPSDTLFETPVIVDLDHDGITEIIVTGCQSHGQRTGQVIVYECPGSALARDVWNQFAHHSTNVNCDGTIPVVEAPPAAAPGWLAQESEGGGGSCSAGPDVRASCDGVQLHGEPGCGGGPVLWTSSCPGTTFLPSADVLDPFVVLASSCLTCTLTLTGPGCADSLTVTIDDVSAPVVTESDALLACVWPPNHRMRCFGSADFSPPVITDDCSLPVTWVIDSCASDQPADDLGDGAFEPDCVVDGDQVCVRAERQGMRPEGRTYSVSIRATDACGNTSGPARIGRIHVPHDQGPGDPCSHAGR